MRTLILAVMFAVYSASPLSHANPWGVGIQMGDPACGYPQQVGGGAMSEDDDIYVAKQERRKAKRKWDEAKRKFQRAEAQEKKFAASLTILDGQLLADMKLHMEHGRNISDWEASCNPPATGVAASANTPGGWPQPAGGAKPSGGFGYGPAVGSVCDQFKRWKAYANNGGAINPAICEKDSPHMIRKSASGMEVFNCQKAIEEYGRTFQDRKALAAVMFDAEKNYAQADNEVKEAIADAKARREDGDYDEEDGRSVAHCPSGDCYRRGPSDKALYLNAGMQVLGGLLAYNMGSRHIKTQREISLERIRSNERLGWPQLNAAGIGAPSYGMGYPFVSPMGGYGGGVGVGIGSGAFGCGNSFGQMNPAGGPFGYPPGMMPGMPGGNQWNNPYGNPMMGNPMMGNPMMNPMMMGQMNPFMQNPMMNPMMMGNPMMNPMMAMMNPAMMGNPMMGNPMMGNPMMGNPMMNPLGGANMQMQMMQQYMQQMQQQAQMQQSQMQDYMYRQQTVMSLTSELNRIQQQIYMISAGGSHGGGGGGPGGYQQGPSILPYPGPQYGTPPYIPGAPGFPSMPPRPGR